MVQEHERKLHNGPLQSMFKNWEEISKPYMIIYKNDTYYSCENYETMKNMCCGQHKVCGV
jgi:hypothetical protein